MESWLKYGLTFGVIFSLLLFIPMIFAFTFFHFSDCSITFFGDSSGKCNTLEALIELILFLYTLIYLLPVSLVSFPLNELLNSIGLHYLGYYGLEYSNMSLFITFIYSIYIFIIGFIIGAIVGFFRSKVFMSKINKKRTK